MSIQTVLENNEGFFFRFETFAEIRKSLFTTYGKEANSILENAAIHAGERSGQRRLAETKTKQEALNLLTTIKSTHNWGDIVFSEVNFEKKKGSIIVNNSFEARKGKSQTPICNFLTGYLEGFLSEILDETIHVEEQKCKSQNNSKCEFIFYPSKY